MVPGSTLIYGSSFCTATLNPRSLRIKPDAAAVTPFPTDETTPPVKKRYFVVISHLVRGIQRRWGGRLSPPHRGLRSELSEAGFSFSSHQLYDIFGSAPH